MESITTLILILTPLFIGFGLPSSKRLLCYSELFMRYLVFVMLAYIGIELAQIDGLTTQLPKIIQQVTLLSILTISFGLIGVMLLDKLIPFSPRNKQVSFPDVPQNVSFKGSLLQLASVVIGVSIGCILPDYLLPPNGTMTIMLMLLILSVGVSLKGSGITLKEVLLNKHAVLISLFFIISVLLSGLVFALIMPSVSISQGLALSSGFGWYSLSAVVMTESYGALWGSVALFNDLAREFFALIFIPLIMRKFPYSAIAVGGATSLDFALPTIQQSGGIQVVPLAISFGFITNIFAPVLMVVFSSI